AGGEERIGGGAGRVGEHAADAGAAALQVLAHPGEGAAGAARGDEGVEATVGLVPDLRARGARVHLAVRGVVELVRPDGARQAGGEALRDLLVLVWGAVGGRRDGVELGAGDFQQGGFVTRLVVRRHAHAAVSATV